MLPDPDRLTAALSALAGGVFWALFHVATTALAGQPVSTGEWIRLVANGLIGLMCGGLMAYFLAPALAPLVPFQSLRDLHAVGFGIGAVAWEVAPFLYRWLNASAAERAAKVQGD